MACCETKQTSVHDFIVSKAKNMLAMLQPYIKTEEHKAMLAQYGEGDIETVVKTYLAPLYATGTLSIAAGTLISELKIEDPAIQEKIKRYLQCFCEALL
jgi:hypothetical protein